MMKKITAMQAKKINRLHGLETWDGDGSKTYWATDENETGTYMFDSRKERDEFVEKKNRKGRR